jgi:hypothetical protein
VLDMSTLYNPTDVLQDEILPVLALVQVPLRIR